MSETAVISFYTYGVLFANTLVIKLKVGYKAVPVIHINRVIAYFELLEMSS